MDAHLKFLKEQLKRVDTDWVKVVSVHDAVNHELRDLHMEEYDTHSDEKTRRKLENKIQVLEGQLNTLGQKVQAAHETAKDAVKKLTAYTSSL